MTQFHFSETEIKFIEASTMTNKHLSDFLKCNGGQKHFVSLGENCSSAWYLKQSGLKMASYPFDWIFSSPEIILDCINDNFKKFMDKSLINPNRNNLSAGHRYYHRYLFNHRNPLNSEEDYDYYHKCCERFNNLIKTKYNTTYFITLINEPDKRPRWANGFTKYFPMPMNQNHKTFMDLIHSLKEKNNDSQFIIVDHYTNQKNRRLTFEKFDANIFFITFYAGGESTGVYYKDPLDDLCFKRIMANLHNGV
jgi:hypothetical protein